MIVKKLQLSGYRNIEDMYIEPDEGINIIFGENAQGKTNLIESIWLFSGFKSFRGSKDNDLIGFDKDLLKLNMEFYGGGRDQRSTLVISRQSKKIILNSVPLNAVSKLIGNFNCVVFSPAYLSIVKGSPAERRRFIDTALCQIKPSYAKLFAEYKRILDQRNSLLKQIKTEKKGYEFLDIWNEKLSEKNVTVIKERKEYLKIISDEATSVFEGLSGNREKIEIKYEIKIPYNRYSYDDEITKEEFYNILKDHENSDIITGSTEIGVHRDDIDIKINGRSAKSFASQGQQRSAALSLKLAEAEILKNITGEDPVILLDDVMSELDINRQDYILNHIKGRQVFITCCEPSTVLRMCKGKTFNIEKGKLI